MKLGSQELFLYLKMMTFSIGGSKAEARLKMTQLSFGSQEDLDVPRKSPCSLKMDLINSFKTEKPLNKIPAAGTPTPISFMWISQLELDFPNLPRAPWIPMKSKLQKIWLNS